MKIYEAAKMVLNEGSGPMSAKEIYSEIVRRELYSFGAKNPVSVLSQAMGDRSIDGKKNVEVVFVRTAPSTFDLCDRS